MGGTLLDRPALDSQTKGDDSAGARFIRDVPSDNMRKRCIPGTNYKVEEILNRDVVSEHIVHLSEDGKLDNAPDATPEARVSLYILHGGRNTHPSRHKTRTPASCGLNLM